MVRNTTYMVVSFILDSLALKDKKKGKLHIYFESVSLDHLYIALNKSVCRMNVYE